MRLVRLGHGTPARIVGPVVRLILAGLLLSLAAPRPAAAASGPLDDHAQALAALADVKAAVGEIVQAEGSYATDRTLYRRASQRAINALTGAKGDFYEAAAGSPGDQPGAIGHIDALLDRRATPVWVDALHGAEANMRAAILHLQDANRARELMGYQIAASRALAYLEVARGRPTEAGVLGGLEGVLANTVLGVPDGATQEDACAAPTSAPAYGTHGGYVAWVALPTGEAEQHLAEPTGGTGVEMLNGMVVLHTAAAGLVAKQCAKAAAPPVHTAAAAATAVPKPPAVAAGHGIPALYTQAQALAGAQVFASRCSACHGTNLQGVAAPSVAGNDFLVTAEHNGWTLAIIRYIVFNLMPRNAPSALAPKEYAEAMAFLLASNCYPPGSTPFPTAEEPSFAAIRLGPVPGVHPGQNKVGVCPVK